jgi:hypothetical protein
MKRYFRDRLINYCNKEEHKELSINEKILKWLKHYFKPIKGKYVRKKTLRIGPGRPGLEESKFRKLKLRDENGEVITIPKNYIKNDFKGENFTEDLE